MIERVIEQGLQIAEKKGDEIQQIDMRGMAQLTMRSFNELDDYFSGRKNPSEHIHHSFSELAESVLCGVELVFELVREIEERP